VRQAWGDADHPMMARSSIKPLQAIAMVRCGLDLPDDLLALAASSHSGENRHLDGVRRILRGVGLSESDLRTPVDFPLEPRERDAWIAAGREQSSIAMNCSGKHAAMLATCVVQGWSTSDYLHPEHPLQQAILVEVQTMTGDEVSHEGVDGCGAPVHVITLSGLARGVSRAVTSLPGSVEHRVVDAMRAHPLMVGGEHRDVTAFMRAVPMLVAKDGAEGVYVASLSDGTTVAIKVDDGAARARQVALATILDAVVPPEADRAALAALARIDVRGGGEPVGQVS
jgi:L-asparaginase II